MIVTIPGVRTVSEANSHEHWRERQKRAKEQRELVALVVRAQGQGDAFRMALDAGLDVFITRVAPRGLDTDNLAGALKACRDGVADWLGIDDRDPRVTWHVRQEQGAPKSYGVRVEVRRREAPLAGLAAAVDGLEGHALGAGPRWTALLEAAREVVARAGAGAGRSDPRMER